MGRDTLLLGTRKGFVVYRRKGDSWESGGIHHKGIPVSIATADSRNGRWWAMLDHGHWGTKLSYSDHQGANWNEVEAPVIPEGEEIHAGVPASTRLLWAFAEGGANYPNRIWIGTEPGALFKSEDNGQSFKLVRGLWDHPSRLEQWQGEAVTIRLFIPSWLIRITATESRWPFPAPAFSGTPWTTLGRNSSSVQPPEISTGAPMEVKTGRQ